MKYVLIFIYRLLNIIFLFLYGIVGFLYFGLLPIWMIFGYLFYGEDYFFNDPCEHCENIFEIIRYPLNKFKEFIDDIDDHEFKFNYKFNKDFWK